MRRGGVKEKMRVGGQQSRGEERRGENRREEEWMKEARRDE